MYKLLLLQFLRSRAVVASLVLILVLGAISIGIGHQFLSQKKAAIDQVENYQQNHIDRNVTLHKDDLGLLMYYVKFAFINSPTHLSGLSIGQSDVNTNLQRITIKNLEGQRYDTDLVNPMNLQSGNLDLSFVLLYLFPLLIIVFTFNLLSEETETGTWRLVSVQTPSKQKYLLTKLSIRVLLIYIVLGILFTIAKSVLSIPLDMNFMMMIFLSLLYVAFWFALCFFVINFKKSSGFNALLLLSIWLVLLILLPAGINAYLANKYPVPEALSTMISQRDGYHTKWDTDKTETLQKFYDHYPQFQKFGYPIEGFNWTWYYAMQQMGDDDSVTDTKALREKISERESVSKQLSAFLPNMHLQLAFNELAGTSLDQHLNFLDATANYHEELRLFFYPKIFEEKSADVVDWRRFTPKYADDGRSDIKQVRFIWPLLIATFIMLLCCVAIGRKLC
ncbi:DUF3526 domain-containing protein [Flagellimonas sp. HMM57]|uniref:ABC transporter permease n=1 Tax=unclassified Flagellimonas TaxID=2644544 RepID=UPI0013D42857|nr:MULTISPECIES: DUF3526 domain-containing protein [unclassified Flagellimonas]UII76688.1 DUF3526 domain-containing protein [Flagellimonas sp. HMM57]